ncbi:MAG: hypothetical protein KJO50_04470, partial [Bacteroidia bacterium]|nr:hypothetical protein [Bacteroidia bacterium]
TLGCGSDIVGIADFIVIDECGNSNVATAYVYNSGNKIVSNSYSAGSAIINMSVMPQTYENGLLPYGLIYELAGLQIPVDWVIKRAKKLNDIDFSIDGIEFRSGAFIIRREFMDNDRSVRPLLSEWEAKGVVIHFASTDFNAPLYKTIRSFPKVIIDGNNAQLIENAFYNRSDIPAEAYSKGLPSDLGSCEQLYVLTHGDPHTWNLDEVSILKNYLENGGSIWVGCHAVSAFETYTNSSMEDACISDLNLLSNSGMIPWSNSNSCSIEKHNNSNNTPFAYDSLRGSLPVFQFMGRMDKAYQAGSEQIMMPNPDGWRSTTQLLVTDTMHSQVLANGGALSPGPAALVAYGPAYGDIELGKVLYQTSHNIATGDEQEDVAAARLFGNFLLESSGSGNTLEVCSSVVTEEVSCGIEYVLDAEVKSSTPFISNWNSNCSGIIINPDSLRARYIPVDSESGDCIIRLTVSNDCNHIDYIAHNIVLIDTIEPELIKEAEDLVLVYEDSASMQLKIQQWLDMHGMAEAIDDCNLNWENNYVPFSISLADLPYTYPVTFFADDDKKSAGVVTLGNIIVVVQPGDLVVECDGSGNVAELTNWLDTHAGVVISGLCVDQVWTDDFTGLSDDCGETGSATVTFTVTDNCSNQATITASFTIVDTQSPNLVCPPDTLGNCSISEIQPYLTLLDFINAGGIADDMCAVDSTSFFPISEVTDEGECPETYTRVYVVSDECGNGSTCSQDIILQFKEEDAPSISCPPQITIDCHIDNAPPYATFDEFLTAGGSASDGCQIDSTSLTLLSQGADKFCGGSVTRVYEISDMCGNKDNCQHKIIVDDTTVPTISCPDTIYGLCLITEIPPYTYTEFLDAGGSASDNCGLDTLTFGQAGLSHDNQDCPRTYLRTYEIEDDCGNVAECDQTIIIHDTIPPVLTCPDTLFLVCNILEEGPFSTYNNFLNGGATGFDDCEINTNSFTLLSEISNGESCPETVTRTYEVSDECGNATSCDQIVFINDEIAPTVQCPNDLTADCNDNLPAPYTDFPAFDSAPNGSASDNCAINGFSVELISETSNNASCPEGITRVYAVSDNCDNQATCEQVITVNDFIEPVFICPDDFTANVCDIIEEPPYTNLIQFLLAGGSASDNCELDTSTFTLTSELSNNADCPETITRRYRIDDVCGNFVECVQRVIVQESVLPVITCPDTIYANCDKNEQAKYNDLVEFVAAGGAVSDNCQIDPSSFNDDGESNDGMTCPNTFTRSYRILDICGNEATCDQILIVADTIAPMIGCLPSIEKECSLDQFPNPETLWYKFLEKGGTGSDDCELDTFQFTYVEDISDGNTCPETYFRVYKIEDLCGNVDTCHQTLVINDIDEPNMNCPGNKTVQCAITDYPVYTSFIELDDDGGSGNDNCELDESTFLYLGQLSDGNSCPEVYTRTYQVSDLCGNSTTCTYEIRIDDTVKPTITCPPTQIAVCSIEEYPAYISVTEFIDAGGILADNCQIDSMGLVLLQQTNNNVCPITYTRKYQISDLCGNIEDCTQLININEDFINPS